MCANYRPVTRLDRLLTFFGVERAAEALPHEFAQEAWPTGLAPFIRRRDDGGRALETGHFGLLPHFAKEVAYGRRTYNARSETVDQLASFKRSWALGRRCIVPAEAVYEPCWETGRAVRWCIRQPGEVPMGIAGIWTEHPWMTGADGQPLLSFAMLTVNADGHPVFGRMHRPGEEKRMVVILEPAEYDHWLQCPPAQAKAYFRAWQGPLDAWPEPLPGRARREPPPALDLA
jgi:putative SOS response-associated peptidase YedK